MSRLIALCLGLIFVQNCNSGSKHHHATTASSSNLSIEGGGVGGMGGMTQSEATGTETAKQIKAEAKAAKVAAKAARRNGGLTPSTPEEIAAKQNIATIVKDASTNGANHVEKIFSDQEITDMVQLIQTDAKTETLTIQTFTAVMRSIAGVRLKKSSAANINNVFAAAFKMYEKSDNTLDTQDLTDLLKGWDSFITNYVKTAP